MKVLINAYACSPYQGSEPGMGWNFVKNLSEKHELHVITESKYKNEIEKYVAENPSYKEHLHFYYIKRDRHNVLRKIWPPSYYWFYKAWQKKALKFAKELDAKENFDLIHQLNMVGFREPGFLYELKKPIVWGPIGGMHITPWKMLSSMGLYGFIYYGMRNVLNIIDMRMKRRPALMAHSCKSIVAATQDACDAVLKLWNKNSIIIPEVGMESSLSKDSFKIRPRGNKMKIVWSGNHTPAKALNFLIEAAALCKCNESLEIHVLGDGVYTHRWKKLAKKLNVENCIFWHGRVPRNEAIEIMKSGDLFCITSLADLTSTVLLEAFSCGLPIISLNLFGFSNAITEKSGIKIEPDSKENVVKGFASAIDKLFENEDLRQQLSLGAFERAMEFAWSKKIEIMNEIYRKAVI